MLDDPMVPAYAFTKKKGAAKKVVRFEPDEDTA